ncbi:hypothetical protein HGM15179_013034 [Zosterops borbonicus]|uniref:Uncharacterized protein n=1 Tax=Zosterops borbonicus TaxID=364589 RepID=A0A8K1G9Z9_9PASS|nr:hypothetical protein HGM15179_013034 [Zosterops borbonicus]
MPRGFSYPSALFPEALGNRSGASRKMKIIPKWEWKPGVCFNTVSGASRKMKIIPKWEWKPGVCFNTVRLWKFTLYPTTSFIHLAYCLACQIIYTGKREAMIRQMKNKIKPTNNNNKIPINPPNQNKWDQQLLGTMEVRKRKACSAEAVLVLAANCANTSTSQSTYVTLSSQMLSPVSHPISQKSKWASHNLQ